jgi:hypothetical protein
VKPAPVGVKKALGFGWIGDYPVIKAFSFVPHANQYLPIHAAAAGDVNLLLMIFVKGGVKLDHQGGGRVDQCAGS